MKRNLKKIFDVIIYISFIISVVSNIIINSNNIPKNNTRILKEMSADTEITDLDKTIEHLNISHTKYANYIQTSKQKIINAINMYPDNNATEENSLDELTTMINNLTNIPENTYFYEQGTEGDSSTIIRYKKIEDSYYVCDANGIVLEGVTPTDVSSKTLLPYNTSSIGNISAGSAGYASGNLYLGDGSNNKNYYDSGILEGMSKIKLTHINRYSSYSSSGTLSHTFAEDGIYLISIGKVNSDNAVTWTLTPATSSQQCIVAKDYVFGWSSVFFAFYEFKAGETISYKFSHHTTSRMAIQMNIDKFN